MGADETLVDVLQERAAVLGDRVCLRYLESGDLHGPINELTYAELARQATAIAATLQQHGAPGDRAMLLFPSGLDFVTAFFGCLLAGIIPVPAYPPDVARPERALAKLRAIAGDCGARLALTTSKFLPTLARIAPGFSELVRCVATDACDDGAAWQRPEISRETVALVQYTSGSTGAPKGAVIRHRQLLANHQSINECMGPTGLVVGWLPVFHDMGLIGNVLHVICAGSSLVLMSPIAFLKRPARWLEAISHYRATTSGGPNFAYDLAVRRVREEDRAKLDLRSWVVAFCGAEPVRAATLDRFCAAFGPHGFARSALYPCYGLAEATLFVAGNPRGTAPTVRTFAASALERGEVRVVADGDRSLVSCGRPGPSEDVRIVDPDRRIAVSPDQVGEIWVRGPAVASGYWGRDEDGSAFGARLETGEGGFLRTGDLGFVHDGELYIAGRSKEMIILAGRNLFPQDLEATVEAAVPAVRKGYCVAFSVERDGDEKLVVVAELETQAVQPDEVVRQMKLAIFEQHQATAFAVVLVRKGTIPKTSSGKLERHACRTRYANGDLA